METNKKVLPGHGTVIGAVDMAKTCSAGELALVHIHRSIRQQVLSEVQEIKKRAAPLNVSIPEPGDRIII